MPTTPRRGFTYPASTDLVSGGPTLFQNLETLLDNVAIDQPSGTLGSRPAASTSGRYYFGTDTGLLYRDNGTSWDTVINVDGAAVSPSARTLGTGAAQAAAGNDSRLSDQRTPLDGSVTLAKLAAAVSQALVPIGSIFHYGANTAPANYLLCDGTAQSRTTYAGLFAIIGTTWGAGDGSTTFNVPDLQGRSLVGAGVGSGLTNRIAGTKGGEETHVLSSGEMPSHTHSQNSHGHSGSADTTNPSVGNNFAGTAGGIGTLNIGAGSGFDLPYSTGATAWGAASMAHSHSLSISAATATNNNTGGDGAHNTMHPWAAARAIIRYQ